MKKAWEWTKAHAVAILAGVAAVLAAFLAWGAYDRKLSRLRDQVTVEKAKGNIAALQAKRAGLMNVAAYDEARIKEIDAKLVENKKAIVAAHNEAANLTTPEEVEDAFKDLGYALIPVMFGLMNFLT